MNDVVLEPCAHPGCDEVGVYVVRSEEVGAKYEGNPRYCQDHFPEVGVWMTEDTSAAANGCAIVLAVVGAAAVAAVGLIV